MNRKFLSLTLIVLALLVLTSCPGPADPKKPTPSYGITPPEWLQGTWENKLYPTESLIISEDNVVYTTAQGFLDTNMKETYEKMTDSVTDTVYTITTHLGYGVTQDSVFTKLGSDTIKVIFIG